MPYLIRTNNDQLILLNNSAKNGLYSQTISSSGLSRPVIINRNNTLNYSATIDSQQNLHIITQPSDEQIMHILYKNNSVSRNIILEDPKGIYDFSNLHILSSKEHVHLFYTANQPSGNSCELIHHILCEESKVETSPILSFESNIFGFRYMSHNDTIFLIYGESSPQYLLNLLIYKDGAWGKASIITTSSFPIDDFQFCIDDKGNIHLIYIQEKYGAQHLIYKKYTDNNWSDEIALYTGATRASIFVYHHGLWVNFMDNGVLKMILSMDYGYSFSKAVDCSLQNSEIERCNFVSAPNLLSSLRCATLHFSLVYPIRAGIISNIDMINLHPDIKPNIELELFLDGIFHTLPKKTSLKKSDAGVPDINALKAENDELKQIQEQMISQYNDMVELTKKIQEEGKKWRTKALSLDSQSNLAEKNQDLPK